MNVPTQAPQPAKKGMGPLGWIGLGCGVVIIIGVIALGAVGYFAKKKLDQFKANPTMTAAELIVKANPDLELVSSDPKKNTMTIRDKKTGKTMTWNADDIKNGRVTVTSDEGTATFDANGKNGGTLETTDEKGQKSVAKFGGTGSPQNLPSWVPSYPGGQAQSTTYDTTGPQGRSALFTISTSDAVDKVIDWYEAELKAQGFTVDKTTSTSNGQTGGMVTGKVADEKRSVLVTIGAAEGKTQAAVMFQEKP
jgi:hypothetical protein